MAPTLDKFHLVDPELDNVHMQIPISLLAALLFFIGLLGSSNESVADLFKPAPWMPSWQIDPMTDKSSCVVFSGRAVVGSGYGYSKVYVGVQDDGDVTIHSDDYPFDPRNLNKIGIRVDNNPPIFGPKKSGNILRFPKNESTKLVNQFRVGKAMRLQVVFFPKGESSTYVFPLDTFPAAIKGHEGCKALRNTDSWIGIYVIDLSGSPEAISMIKATTGRDQTAVSVLAIDPRRAAAKHGVQLYDVILSHDSTPATVKSLDMAVRKMESTGDPIQLEILRGNKIIQKTLLRP